MALPLFNITVTKSFDLIEPDKNRRLGRHDTKIFHIVNRARNRFTYVGFGLMYFIWYFVIEVVMELSINRNSIVYPLAYILERLASGEGFKPAILFEVYRNIVRNIIVIIDHDP